MNGLNWTIIQSSLGLELDCLAAFFNTLLYHPSILLQPWDIFYVSEPSHCLNDSNHREKELSKKSPSIFATRPHPHLEDLELWTITQRRVGIKGGGLGRGWALIPHQPASNGAHPCHPATRYHLNRGSQHCSENSGNLDITWDQNMYQEKKNWQNAFVHISHWSDPNVPYFDLPWPPLPTRSNFFGPKWLVHVSHI